MNSLAVIIDSFNEIKKKGWMKSGSDDETDFYFPACEDISVKCTTDNKRYPIILLAINHGLGEEYLNKDNYYSIETDHVNNVLRLLIYQNNILIHKKELFFLDDFMNYLNHSFERLALILSENKEERRGKYYRYTKMRIYRFKGSDTFIRLLNQKIIHLKINKNCLSFVISKKDLDKLYKMEYRFDDTLDDFLCFLDK